MRKAQILAVDDRANMLKLLSRLLGAEHEVTTCSSGTEALALVGWRDFDLVITDVRMPKVSGMDILRRVREVRPLTQVVIMTAYAEISQAVEAMRQGALDYVTKPFENDVITVVVQKAIEHRRLIEHTLSLQEEVAERYSFANIVGKSEAMQKAFALVRKATDSDSTVLVLGESGTGKELFARAIHYGSRRAAARFVPVNCGAIPRELLESELFGHAKGAFTGASEARRGLFGEAEGGTLFLDEIGELQPDLQIKLNRATQEHEVRPVGETRAHAVDVRIVAATNRDLRKMVERREFREDLFFRLSVFPITIPSLRDRREDIPLLIRHFLQRMKEQQGHQIRGVEPQALKLLMAQDWSGNVRQLENAIERAVLIEESPLITAETVAGGLQDMAPGPVDDPLLDLPYKDAMELAANHATREYLAGLLARTDGNVTRASALAQIERESFHRLMRRCGLTAGDFRGP